VKPLKILSRIGVALLILAAAVLFVRAILNVTEGRRLAGAVAELKSRGLPVSAGDLAAPCPDEENGARQWKAAESLLDLTTDERGLLSQAFLTLVSGKPLPEKDRMAIQAIVARSRGPLGLIHETAAKPCFLYREPAARLTEAASPNAVKTITAARLLGFEALGLAESGDMPGALDAIRSGLRFAAQTASERTLLAYLLSVAETRMLLGFLGEICRGGTVGDETLLRLVADLGPGPWPKRLAASIAGDRVFAVERGSDIVRGRFSATADETRRNRLLYWLMRPILKEEVRWEIKKLTRWEGMTGKPYYEQRELLKTDLTVSGDVPWYFKLTGFLDGGAYGTVFFKAAQLEATLLAARTGLSCRLYKSRTGSYPESLGALVPGILKEVPVDPFTGRPLVYRRDGEGFIVYSLGSNQKDDGGRSTYMITQLVMEKDDDVPWRETR